jgi:hypothetical protein
LEDFKETGQDCQSTLQYSTWSNCENI